MSPKIRRQSVRTRMRTEDVSSWVEHNQPTFTSPDTEQQVRFETPRDDSDTESTSSSLTEKPRYTDGGYGWTVVFFSFILHFILDGVSFSFGVIFPQIQATFGSQRTGASSVASLFLSFPLLLAPVAGSVTDMIGCRGSIILGSAICIVSSLGSMLCPSLWMFTVVFGGGCGFGMSFVYNAAIVIVTYYFNKKRGTATALAVAGTGIGTISYPFILTRISYLVGDFVSELNAHIIILNISFIISFIVGLLIKDVTWESDTKEYKMKKFERQLKKIVEETSTSASKNSISVRRAISLPNALAFSKRLETSSVQSVKEAAEKTEKPSRSRSVATFNRRGTLDVIPEYSMLNTGLEHLEHLDLEMTNSPCTTVHARNRMLSKTSISLDQINQISEDSEENRIAVFGNSSSNSHEGSEVDDGGESSSSDDSEMSNDGDSSSSELSDKAAQERVVEEGLQVAQKNSLSARNPGSAPSSSRYVRNSLAPGLSGFSAGRVIASNAVQPRVQTNLLAMGKVPSAPSLANRKKRRSMLAKLSCNGLTNHLTEEFNSYRGMLQRKSFLAFLGSVFCLYMILDIPYVYFYDYATENLNVDKSDASWTTSVIGFANAFSTYVYGYIADKQLVKDKLFLLYGFSIFLVSVSLFASAFSFSLMTLIMCGASFGLFISANYVLQSVLLTINFENLSNFQGAYSMTSFIEGIACLFGPIIVGLIRDSAGNYFSIFCLSSVIALISSLSSFLSHVYLSKEQQEERSERKGSVRTKHRRSANGNGNNKNANENGNVNGEMQTLLTEV